MKFRLRQDEKKKKKRKIALMRTVYKLFIFNSFLNFFAFVMLWEFCNSSALRAKIHKEKVEFEVKKPEGSFQTAQIL